VWRISAVLEDEKYEPFIDEEFTTRRTIILAIKKIYRMLR